MAGLENKNKHIEYMLSDTDLFTPAFIQTDIVERQYEDIFPIISFEDSGPVKRFIENNTNKYLDLGKS